MFTVFCSSIMFRNVFTVVCLKEDILVTDEKNCRQNMYTLLLTRSTGRINKGLRCFSSIYKKETNKNETAASIAGRHNTKQIWKLRNEYMN
jgi:hypothetical protein